MVKRDSQHITGRELEKMRNARFAQWFKTYVSSIEKSTKLLYFITLLIPTNFCIALQLVQMHNDEIDHRLVEISYGPAHKVQ